MSRASRCAAWLDRDAPPIWKSLDRHERNEVIAGFLRWPGLRSPSREWDPSVWEQLELARYLREQIASLAARHGELSHGFSVFSQRLALAESVSVREALILSFLASLGAGSRQLRGDRRALRRWLDVDAVTERYERERARVERRLCFCVSRLGTMVRYLRWLRVNVEGVPVWRYLDIETALLPLLAFPGDARIREAAFHCLGALISSEGEPDGLVLSSATQRLVHRTVIDHQQPIWLQCEALGIFARLAPEGLGELARRRLEASHHPDAMFFLRRMAEALVQTLPDFPEHAVYLERMATLPLPYLRAGIAELLPTLPAPLAGNLWVQLIKDDEAAVAGQALLQTIKLQEFPTRFPEFVARLVAILDDSPSDFLVRVALHVSPAMVQAIRAVDAVQGDAAHTDLEAACHRLNTRHDRTAIRRHAAMVRELLRGSTVRPGLSELPLHASVGQPRDGDVLAFARSLLPATFQGFGFNLVDTRRRWRIVRDWQWRPRLWRFLHESGRPATDKRQNYPHLRGRVYPGLVHVPSHCVAEVSPTKVPGEPLHIAEEGGWRPWLPLLDQILSALDQDGPLRPLCVVTAEGVTRVHLPARWWDRLRAKWSLTRRFAEVAALRNWTNDSAFSPQAYLEALSDLGIRCEFEPHVDQHNEPYPVDQRVSRFFPRSLAVVPLPMLAWKDYAYSLYQNTLSQLLVFVAVIGLLFFGQHMWLNRRFRVARASIPLVLGGWGTRGKSGTERLKAAVMNALGVRVLSKTTGCEAMFLFGQPNRPLYEMFLFRPYDKATIWEQARLTRIAAALGTDVMLWECMGLNPGYVRVLQQDWMRDDVSTITNCFPDHEDIQGPAGVDLPLVIREFIPKRGVVYTSEENMLPYLAERATAMESQLHATTWLDVGLLTPDILARFPYQEHPANIALVQRMLEGMGLRGDFALKEMADRVVPDLGVLKIYPQARFEGRRIEFINGMSANERYGCLGNWDRTGMAQHRLDADPGVWTVTVVNNRADRVARSEVFAAVLVNDIGADRHYLIGGNLSGLMQFIRESFDRFAASLVTGEAASHGAVLAPVIEASLRRWKVPLSTEEAEARLRSMLRGLEKSAPVDPASASLLEDLAAADTGYAPALRAQWQRDTEDVSRVAALARALADGRADEAKDLLWRLFSARLVEVSDYYTPGNVLLHRMLCEAPPGARIRAMGIQNIKGTGLDFVYRWQAWDQHAKYGQQLAGDDPTQALAAAQALAASTELGILEKESLEAAIAKVRNTRLGQSDLIQVLLARIETNLAEAQTAIAAYAEHRPREGNRLWSTLLSVAERLLDADDSVRRRRRANVIYDDLVAGRIASSRAALELKRLTQRQKGGWLTGS